MADIIGGGILVAVLLRLMKSSEKGKPVGKIKNLNTTTSPYNRLNSAKPALLNEQVLHEDPITLGPMTRPVYLKPNMQNGKVAQLYDYNTVSELLKSPQPKSPFTRRPFKVNNVVRYG